MKVLLKEPLFWLIIGNTLLLAANWLLLRFNDKLNKDTKKLLRDVRAWQNLWKKNIEEKEKRERGF